MYVAPSFFPRMSKLFIVVLLSKGETPPRSLAIYYERLLGYSSLAV